MNNRVEDSRKVEVVKVYRTGPGPAVVIHDQGRRHVVHVMPRDLPGWLALAVTASPQVYARATWSGEAWTFVGVKQVAGGW